MLFFFFLSLTIFPITSQRKHRQRWCCVWKSKYCFQSNQLLDQTLPPNCTGSNESNPTDSGKLQNSSLSQICNYCWNFWDNLESPSTFTMSVCGFLSKNPEVNVVLNHQIRSDLGSQGQNPSSLQGSVMEMHTRSQDHDVWRDERSPGLFHVIPTSQRWRIICRTPKLHRVLQHSGLHWEWGDIFVVFGKKGWVGVGNNMARDKARNYWLHQSHLWTITRAKILSLWLAMSSFQSSQS